LCRKLSDGGSLPRDHEHDLGHDTESGDQFHRVRGHLSAPDPLRLAAGDSALRFSRSSQCAEPRGFIERDDPLRWIPEGCSGGSMPRLLRNRHRLLSVYDRSHPANPSRRLKNKRFAFRTAMKNPKKFETILYSAVGVIILLVIAIALNLIF